MEPGSSSLNSHGLMIHYNQNQETTPTSETSAKPQVNTFLQSETEVPQSVANPAIAEGKDQAVISQVAAQAGLEEAEKKEKAEKKAQEKLAEPKAVKKSDQESEATTAEEKEMIANMKKTIRQSSHKVAQKVNRKAFDYMSTTKGWFKEEKKAQAQEFFTLKIPKVMAKNLSILLNQALGLEEHEADSEVS